MLISFRVLMYLATGCLQSSLNSSFEHAENKKHVNVYFLWCPWIKSTFKDEKIVLTFTQNFTFSVSCITHYHHYFHYHHPCHTMACIHLVVLCSCKPSENFLLFILSMWLNHLKLFLCTHSSTLHVNPLAHVPILHLSQSLSLPLPAPILWLPMPISDN